MRALGNTINLEDGERGVRCTNINPGEVVTEILEKRAVRPSAEKIAKMIHPEDVAEVAVMVASLPHRCIIPEVTVTGLSTIDIAM